MAEEPDVKIDSKLLISAILGRAKQDAGILIVGIGVIASLAGAGAKIQTVIDQQNKQAEQIELIEKTLAIHGAKLDADNDILNILCYQFRCHANEVQRTPANLDPGSAMVVPPKPRGAIQPQDSVLAEKSKLPPISDISRSSW